MHIAIGSQLRKLLHPFRRRWPVDFKLLDFGRAPETKNFPRIMGGKIAAAVVLEPLVHLAAGLPPNTRADGVAVARNTLELQAQPVVPLGGVILQEHGRAAVDSDKDVDRAIIVIVPDRQAT